MAWDDRSGDFCYLDYTMVPYQHHRIKSIWHVKVVQNFQDSKITESGSTSVVAHTAREAAKIGAIQFQQHVEAMKAASKRDRKKNNKDKLKDLNERTEDISDQNSGGEPALD